jgi:hypothetical protein
MQWRQVNPQLGPPRASSQRRFSTPHATGRDWHGRHRSSHAEGTRWVSLDNMQIAITHSPRFVGADAVVPPFKKNLKPS